MKVFRAWALIIAGFLPLAGSAADDPSGKKPAVREKPAEFKGRANVSVHSHKMLKGNSYRITVKGSDFLPQLQILDGRSSARNAVAGNMNYLTPNSAGGNRNTTQVIFTPTETRDYQIRVDAYAGTEPAGTPRTYTLAIERALFKTLIAHTDPRLEVTEHAKKMEQGKTYSIAVTGRGFAPELQVMDGTRSLAISGHGRWFGFGPNAEFITTLTFTPARTKEYRIVVNVGPVVENRVTPLTSMVDIAELTVALSANERLTPEDAVYARRGGRHKLHVVKLQAGKKYQIDMISTVFDTYLFLEDAAGNLLMQDDDGGEKLNARLIFSPAKTGSYRVVATTFNLAAPGVGPGGYQLTVVENPHAQPKFRPPSFAQDNAFPN